MKLKVNDAGLPIQLSPVPKPKLKAVPNVKSSPVPVTSPSPQSELSKGVVLLWSLLTLFLTTVLILVAIALTLCDIVDLEADSKLKLIYLPEQIRALLTDWAPRFLITVIGFMLSVIILVLERNANYQPWDAVLSLLWFTAKLSHLPEISNYFSQSELFIFKCILSASLAALSLILLICHSLSCVKFYCHKETHIPRDVRSINPSHRELVQSFRENNELISASKSKNCSSESSHHQTTISAVDQNPVSPTSSSVSTCRDLAIKPDSFLRKRLAGLSIDKNNKVVHCTTEDEPFDKLLDKLGTDLHSSRDNESFQKIEQQTNWITSGFWATRCYGNKTNYKEGNNIQTSMFASFSASWSRFIPDGSGSRLMSNVTQQMVKISNLGTWTKSMESVDLSETSNQKVVQPSKLNILSQLTYK